MTAPNYDKHCPTCGANADARLISKAPEMATMLGECMEAIEDWHDKDPAWPLLVERARALLAAVRGEEG